jgi:hypothetical protein
MFEAVKSQAKTDDWPELLQTAVGDGVATKISPNSVSKETLERLGGKAREIRREILTMVYRAKSGHIGGSFSAVELVPAGPRCLTPRRNSGIKCSTRTSREHSSARWRRRAG